MNLGNDLSNEVGKQPQTPDSGTLGMLDVQEQAAKIDNYKQNTEERKKYADLIFQFTCFWCLFVGFILLGCGLNKIHLSDLILTTLLGTATVNVFGFFLLVTKYLFNETKST